MFLNLYINVVKTGLQLILV